MTKTRAGIQSKTKTEIQITETSVVEMKRDKEIEEKGMTETEGIEIVKVIEKGTEMNVIGMVIRAEMKIEKETEKEEEIEMQETEKEMQIETEKEIEIETEMETETGSQTEGLEIEIGTKTKETQKETDPEKEKQKEIEKETENQIETEKETEMEEIETDTEAEMKIETDADVMKRTEKRSLLHQSTQKNVQQKDKEAVKIRKCSNHPSFNVNVSLLPKHNFFH